MKTTAMASAALLLVVALALVLAPLTVDAMGLQAKKKKGDIGESEQTGPYFNCSQLCNGRKGNDFISCRDSCDAQHRGELAHHERMECQNKCADQKGATPPAKKLCAEQCEKKYKAVKVEVAAACDKACNLEDFPGLRDGCKEMCNQPK